MEEADGSGDSDYERVHALAAKARAAAGVPGGRGKRGSGQQQQQQRGSTGGKKQPTQRRRARERGSQPDQDDEADEAAAAAADDNDDEALAGQAAGEGEEAEEESEEEEEQYTAEQYEAMLAEDANEVVAVRLKGLAGHLKAIQVVNFMCHHNFAMNFG
jgi:hypothetical protein